MKYAYDQYKSLIIVNKNISKDYFLNQSGASHGYALDMFSRIYECIFSEAESLEDIFERYYIQEYQDIKSILYHKYCINRDDVKMIMELKNSNPDYVIYDFDELNYGDSGSITFAFSEEICERITNLLLMKE